MDGRPIDDLRHGLPPLDARMVLRVAVVFALCLGLWMAIRGPFLRSVAYASAPILRQVVDIPGERAVKMDGPVVVINSGIASPGRPGRNLTLRLGDLAQSGWNACLWMGLVALTPWRRLRRSWLWLAGGCFLVWLAQVLTLSLESIRRLAGLYAYFDLTLMSARSVAWVETFKLYLTISSPFLAVVVMLPVWLRRPKPATAASVGRNAPCPCGSGRKSKRCCGR